MFEVNDPKKKIQSVFRNGFVVIVLLLTRLLIIFLIRQFGPLVMTVVMKMIRFRPLRGRSLTRNLFYDSGQYFSVAR